MKFFTRSYFKNVLLHILLVAIGISGAFNGNAQINVTTGYVATQMAQKLAGPGVAIFNATMTCDTVAYGQFVTVSSILGLDSGIILTCGRAHSSGFNYGVDGPASNFASNDNLAPGDPDLQALAGQVTHDACILQFDFKPAGDTVSFKYVFGSEEYTSFTCSQFNDVFGFFISGGAYGTPVNIAKVPGTSIPVCINSVNCGATGFYVIDTCNALGAGSPFCAYYVNNSAGTTVTYDGLTTPLFATALVSPCDTYHLKLGIADAFDGVYDSGVFIEAGSLTSRPPVTISGVGLSGLPYCVRGCLGAAFQFSIPTPQDTPVVVHYNISGTAVNSYDYATLSGTVTIPPLTTIASVNVNPYIVTPVGPKTVTLEVLVEDPCHPGVFVAGASSTITILDSFVYNIVTPDTAICNGQSFVATATGDPLFGAGVLHYQWVPSSSVTNDTTLTPTLAPTATTTYDLQQSSLGALGCPTKHKYLTVRVYDRPILSNDSALVKTCVGSPVTLHEFAVPDTIPNTFSWSPATNLNNPNIWDPTVTPTSVGDFYYTVTVNPTAIPGCTSTDMIHVHVLGDFAISPLNSNICLGQSVAVTSTGSTEMSYTWTPSAGVVSSTSIAPVITPTAAGAFVYSVHASYANCPGYNHTLNIHIDTPATPIVLVDTICLGMTYMGDFTVPGGAYYHYQWASTPTTVIFGNDTMSATSITPTAPGLYDITATIQPLGPCATINHIHLDVLPNAISVRPTDTTICAGQVVQAIGQGDPAFHYQWLPTAGIAISDVLNALITPDTTTFYTVTASFHSCPDMTATLNLHVDPNPTVYLGGSRIMCQFDSTHLHAAVSPAWFSGYTYAWTPAADLDMTTAANAVFTGNASTYIYVTVTTPAGCQAKDSAYITVINGNFAPTLPDLAFCPHDTAVLNSGGPAGYSYQWYPSLYISDSTADFPVIRPEATQVYTVVVSNANGCRDTVNFTATVHPAALISLDDSVVLYPGESFHISPVTNCSSFSWFPYAGLSSPFISDPTATPDISTKYLVNAVTEYGCKAVDSINVIVNEESLLALPNAFTPGTGANSEFKIILRGIANLNYFRIFNRWGNLVFETKNIAEGWDGSWKGVPQPFGVYVYEIQAVTSTGKVFTKSGNVTIIR